MGTKFLVLLLLIALHSISTMRNTSKVIVVVTVVAVVLTTYVSALNTCSKCGTMEVPYPLSTNKDCGDPRYKIHCNSGSSLEFESAKGLLYKIISINTSTHSLVIKPPKIDTNICYSDDISGDGLWLDEGLPFNISNRNTVMLFNCSDNILRSPLDCSQNSLCRKFENRVEEGCKNTLCCTYLKDASQFSHRIRVRVGSCTAYTSVVNIKEKDLPVDWNYGIELQWLPPY